MVKRLFFIRTPLQALIVQAIRNLGQGDDTIIYHPTSDSPKHRAYFDRLGNAEKVFVPVSTARSHTLGELSRYWKIPRDIRNASFDEYHLASIGSIPFALLAADQPAAKMGLFDDGIFNLDADYLDNWINGEPSLSRWIKRAARAPNNSALAANFSIYHTIFTPEKLVIQAEKIVPLELFQSPTTGSRPITVVLGTPAHLFSKTAQKEYARVLAALDCDLFIPHPAEHTPPKIGASLNDDPDIRLAVESHIAEDIIQGLCSRGFLPQVYGFGSTALANVAHHLDVTNIVISGLNSARADVMAGLGVATCASHAID